MPEVKIPTGGITLSGDLHLPGAPNGLVLFAHGSGSSRTSPRNNFVAAVIRDAGIGTLLFDLLTKDEEFADMRTGHLRFDIGFLAKRLRDATHWALSQEPVRELPIGYFGASTGGGAALVAAAEEGTRVGAVVSRGGRPDLAGRALKQVRAPTLLIVGGLDEPVIRMNQDALRELDCKKELKIIPGATHLFSETGALEQVARLAADWFAEHLVKRHDGAISRPQ